MNGNTNRQGCGKEKLIKTVLQMRWSITEIQSLIVHLKHNMQSGTNIQLCSLGHFRNELFSYKNFIWTRGIVCIVNIGYTVYVNIRWTHNKGYDILRASYLRTVWQSSCMGSQVIITNSVDHTKYLLKLMDKSFASSDYKIHSPKSWNWYLVDTLPRSLYFWPW